MKRYKIKFNNYTKKIIYTAVIIITFVICIIVTNFYKNIDKEQSKEVKNIDINLNISKHFIGKFEGYVTYVNNHDLYIGKSLKEIENEYFDVKIDFFEYEKNHKIDLYINKLNKNHIVDNSQTDILVDKVFLNNLINSINNVFEYGLIEVEKNKLQEYIENEYISFRKNNIDDMDKQSSIKDNINIGKINISCDILDNIMVLIMEKR